MRTYLTDAIKQEIAQHLKNNWQIIDITNRYNICPATIRKINKMYNCNRIIPSDYNIGYLRKQSKKNNNINIMPKIINECINKNIDKHNVELDLEAFKYFKEQTKKYFNPVLCDVIIAKDKRPYEIQYHITHGFVNVCYIYKDVNETFKYKFINDFYKNKLTKENLKELIAKKNIFEAIIDKDNNKCIFDLDLFLNNTVYKEAVNLSNITKVAPKI